MPNWSRKMVDRTEKLAERGCSCAAIAETLNAEFGAALTRSAVSGKVWREGIEMRGICGREAGQAGAKVTLDEDTVIDGMTFRRGSYKIIYLGGRPPKAAA